MVAGAGRRQRKCLALSRPLKTCIVGKSGRRPEAMTRRRRRRAATLEGKDQA
jgi:hypothetical protein